MSSIQLLKKACQLVDELARIGPSTSAELAKAVSEPRPTVYRIVASLQEAELVRSAGDGRIELGTAIFRYSESAAEALVDRAELRAQLHWVRRRLGMTAFFCILRDYAAVCLEQVDGADVDLFDLAPGRILPLHAGAASQALLAFGPAGIRDATLAAATYRRIAGRTPQSAEALRENLERAASRGWGIEEDEVIDGVATIAVPVFERGGTLMGAVAVAGLSASVHSQQEAAREVLESAAQGIIGSEAKAAADRAGGAAGTAADASVSVPAKASAVIAKAGALMEVLAAERIATSTRLTELLGEPVSSVYRMLATLAEEGWVEQIGPRGAYRVGSAMLSLSGELTRRLDVRQAAAPIMRRIHGATGETTFLCIRRGARAVCIDRIDGIRVNSRVLQLGNSLPLHVGAAPRALLAFEEREAWEEYASVVANSGESWRGVKSLADLYNSLEEIRAQGFVRSDNNVTPGIAAIGAPIFNHRGEVVASLSVSGLREGILAEPDDGDSVTDLVRDGARALSRYLGAPVVSSRPTAESAADDVSELIV
ncbi:IclR family transcriptional regulator [Arthrobacter pigmenti]